MFSSFLPKNDPTAMEVSHNSHCICHHLLWVQVMYWLIATVTKTTALSFCMLGSTWKSDLLPEEIPIPRWLTTCVLRAAPLNVPSLQTAPFKIACLNAATNTTLSILFSWKFVWVVMDGNWGGTVKTYSVSPTSTEKLWTFLFVQDIEWRMLFL